MTDTEKMLYDEIKEIKADVKSLLISQGQNRVYVGVVCGISSLVFTLIMKVF